MRRWGRNQWKQSRRDTMPVKWPFSCIVCVRVSSVELRSTWVEARFRATWVWTLIVYRVETFFSLYICVSCICICMSRRPGSITNPWHFWTYNLVCTDCWIIVKIRSLSFTFGSYSLFLLIVSLSMVNLSYSVCLLYLVIVDIRFCFCLFLPSACAFQFQLDWWRARH